MYISYIQNCIIHMYMFIMFWSSFCQICHQNDSAEMLLTGRLYSAQGLLSASFEISHGQDVVCTLSGISWNHLELRLPPADATLGQLHLLVKDLSMNGTSVAKFQMFGIQVIGSWFVPSQVRRELQKRWKQLFPTRTIVDGDWCVYFSRGSSHYLLVNSGTWPLGGDPDAEIPARKAWLVTGCRRYARSDRNGMKLWNAQWWFLLHSFLRHSWGILHFPYPISLLLLQNRFVPGCSLSYQELGWDWAQRHSYRKCPRTLKCSHSMAVNPHRRKVLADACAPRLTDGGAISVPVRKPKSKGNEEPKQLMIQDGGFHSNHSMLEGTAWANTLIA